MDQDHTTTDIGESGVSGPCSATVSYGDDEADSDYTTTSDAETQDSDAEGEGPHADEKQRRHLNRPSIHHHTSPHGRKPMTLLHDQVQKPIKSVMKTCR